MAISGKGSGYSRSFFHYPDAFAPFAILLADPAKGVALDKMSSRTHF
jgi:hypothetical protein